MEDLLLYMTFLECGALGFLLGSLWEFRHLKRQGRIKGEWG